MTIFTDYSFWNGLVNTEKAKTAGAEGAYYKASQAEFTDKRFLENFGSCVLRDKGGYHFLDYHNYLPGQEIAFGQRQAAYHVKTLHLGGTPTLKSALDLEDNSGSGWAKLDLVLDKALKIALAWVNEYKRLMGHYPLMYLNSGLTIRKDYLGRWVFRNFEPCPLWVANYNQVQVPYTGMWKEYALWQYSSQGDGYLFGNSIGNKFVDLNKVGNINALRINAVMPPEDETIPPVTEPTLKTYCKYCTGFTFDDSRGNCGACGAPRETIAHEERVNILWADYLARVNR